MSGLRSLSSSCSSLLLWDVDLEDIAVLQTILGFDFELSASTSKAGRSKRVDWS